MLAGGAALGSLRECDLYRAITPEQLDRITLGEVKALAENQGDLVSRIQLQRVIDEIGARNKDYAYLTPEVIAETFRRSARAFSNDKQLFFGNRNTPDEPGAYRTLGRFGLDAHNDLRFARLERERKQAQADAAAALTLVASGRLPSDNLSEPAASFLFGRMTVTQLDAMREKLRQPISAEEKTVIEKFLAKAWAHVKGPPSDRPHEALFQVLDTWRLEAAAHKLFGPSDFAPSDSPVSQLALTANRTPPPSIPGWTRPQRAPWNVSDPSRRVVTILHEGGEYQMPWLMHSSDVVIRRTNPNPGGNGPMADRDPWLKDHLPMAVPVGSGKDRHYVLLHYNDREGRRGFFPETLHATRPSGIPPEAKAFDVGGHYFWAVPRGTEMKFERGKFSKDEGFRSDDEGDARLESTPRRRECPLGAGGTQPGAQGKRFAPRQHPGRAHRSCGSASPGRRLRKKRGGRARNSRLRDGAFQRTRGRHSAGACRPLQRVLERDCRSAPKPGPDRPANSHVRAGTLARGLGDAHR
jgi:hypothetical protein